MLGRRRGTSEVGYDRCGTFTPGRCGHIADSCDVQVPGEGLFTEGCMVLIEGEYTVEEDVRVLAMGHPPSEKRDISR